MEEFKLKMEQINSEINSTAKENEKKLSEIKKNTNNFEEIFQKGRENLKNNVTNPIFSSQRIQNYKQKIMKQREEKNKCSLEFLKQSSEKLHISKSTNEEKEVKNENENMFTENTFENVTTLSESKSDDIAQSKEDASISKKINRIQLLEEKLKKMQNIRKQNYSEENGVKDKVMDQNELPIEPSNKNAIKCIPNNVSENQNQSCKVEKDSKLTNVEKQDTPPAQQNKNDVLVDPLNYKSNPWRKLETSNSENMSQNAEKIENHPKNEPQNIDVLNYQVENAEKIEFQKVDEKSNNTAHILKESNDTKMRASKPDSNQKEAKESKTKNSLSPQVQPEKTDEVPKTVFLETNEEGVKQLKFATKDAMANYFEELKKKHEKQMSEFLGHNMADKEFTEQELEDLQTKREKEGKIVQIFESLTDVPKLEKSQNEENMNEQLVENTNEKFNLEETKIENLNAKVFKHQNDEEAKELIDEKNDFNESDKETRKDFQHKHHQVEQEKNFVTDVAKNEKLKIKSKNSMKSSIFADKVQTEEIIKESQTFERDIFDQSFNNIESNKEIQFDTNAIKEHKNQIKNVNMLFDDVVQSVQVFAVEIQPQFQNVKSDLHAERRSELEKIGEEFSKSVRSQANAFDMNNQNQIKCGATDKEEEPAALTMEPKFLTTNTALKINEENNNFENKQQHKEDKMPNHLEECPIKQNDNRIEKKN